MSKKKNDDDIIKTAITLAFFAGLGYVFDTTKEKTFREVEKKVEELFKKAEEKLSEQS